MFFERHKSSILEKDWWVELTQGAVWRQNAGNAQEKYTGWVRIREVKSPFRIKSKFSWKQFGRENVKRKRIHDQLDQLKIWVVKWNKISLSKVWAWGQANIYLVTRRKRKIIGIRKLTHWCSEWAPK